jgi:hypothetical protein
MVLGHIGLPTITRHQKTATHKVYKRLTSPRLIDIDIAQQYNHTIFQLLGPVTLW